MWEIPRDYWCGLHFAGIHFSAWQTFIHVQPLKNSKTICRVEEKVRPKKATHLERHHQRARLHPPSVRKNSCVPRCSHLGMLFYQSDIFGTSRFLLIIPTRKTPLQACSSISEFLYLAGLMPIFSHETSKQALSAICDDRKGLKERGTSTTVPGLMCWW